MGQFFSKTMSDGNPPIYKVPQTTEEYNALLAGTDKLIIVDFFATWCGPCKTISPHFVKLLTDNEEKVVGIKVDVDELEEVAAAAGVSAMPTFHAMKNGVKIGEVMGANPDKLTSLVIDNM